MVFVVFILLRFGLDRDGDGRVWMDGWTAGWTGGWIGGGGIMRLIRCVDVWIDVVVQIQIRSGGRVYTCIHPHSSHLFFFCARKPNRSVCGKSFKTTFVLHYTLLSSFLSPLFFFLDERPFEGSGIGD